MPSAVTCGDCGAQFEVTQQLWDDQIGGKVVRVRCKRCGAKIELDGRDPDAAPKHSKPPPPNAREKLTSIIDSEPDGIREETPTVPLTKPGQLPGPGKLPSLKSSADKAPAASKDATSERAASGEKPGASTAHAKATQTAGPSDPWLVSYADDDDRELSTDAVKAAFQKGEIHTETLIWRDGMDEWLVITEVPVFTELFKKAPATDQTGGFLGTGVGLGVGSGGPIIHTDMAGTEDDDDAPPISLVPESLPPESIDPDSLGPDSVEPKLVALAAGTMAETKPKGPPPRREPGTGSTPKPAGVKLPTPKVAKAAAQAEAPHVKRLPKPPAAPLTKTGFIPSQASNPKPEPDSAEARPTTEADASAEKPQGKAKPRPPANLKRPQTVAFEREEPAPDSIPDVAALSRKAGTLQATKDSKADDLPLTGGADLSGIGLGTTDDAPLAPTIKVDDLVVDVDTGDGAEVEDNDAKPVKAAASGASSDSAPVSSKSGKKKKTRSTQSGPPSSRKIRTETHSDAPVTRSRPPAAAAKTGAASQAVASEAPAEDASGSKTPLYIAVGLAAAFAVYWFGIRDATPPDQPKPQPVATQTSTADSPSPATTATSTAEPEATAEPVAEPESDKPAEPAPDATGKNPTETAKPLGTAAAPEPTAAPKPTATGAATAAAPKPTAEKPEPTAKPTAAPPPDEPTAVATAPFNVPAAQAALSSAASAASACRKPGDPSGIAHVTITFAPSGRATSANIGGPPFAGTATGGCIAGTMRSARVPAFTGAYKTVSKTVVIN